MEYALTTGSYIRPRKNQMGSGWQFLKMEICTKGFLEMARKDCPIYKHIKIILKLPKLRQRIIRSIKYSLE